MESFPYDEYPPTYGAQEEISDNILSSDFGDSYSQAVPDGINYRRSKYSVSWENHHLDDALIIWNFLRPKVNLDSFMWKWEGVTDEIQVRCTTLTRSFPKFNVQSITATFVTNYDI